MSQRKATDLQILAAIKELGKDYGPSRRELAKRVGISSTSTIHRRLQRLQLKGLVKNMNVIRGLSLTAAGANMVAIEEAATKRKEG